MGEFGKYFRDPLWIEPYMRIPTARVVIFFVDIIFGIVAVMFAQLRREGDRCSVLGGFEHGGAGVLNCCQGIFEAFFQVKAVGHHQGGVFHALAVL